MLNYLHQIQDIDLKTDRIKTQKKKLLKEIQEKKEQSKKEKKEFENLTKELNEKEKERKQKEKDLKYEEDIIKKWESRLKEIKKPHEYQTLLFEISRAKKANEELEEEILKLMDEEEDLKNKRDKKKEMLEQIESELNEREKDIMQEIQDLENLMKEQLKLREEIGKKIDINVLSKYNLIRQKRGGLAIVRVIDGICQGCNMNIPPQVYYEVMKNASVITCPHCQRILYFSEKGEKNPGGRTNQR